MTDEAVRRQLDDMVARLARVEANLDRLVDALVDVDAERERREQRERQSKAEAIAHINPERRCPGFGEYPECLGMKSATATRCRKCAGNELHKRWFAKWQDEMRMLDA